MKLTTILLTLVLAFGSVLSAQDKKGAVKKKAAEASEQAKDSGKKGAGEVKEAAKKAAETKGEAKGEVKKAVAAKKKAAEDDDNVPDAQRCNATTQAGTRCKRKAADGSKFCWQHSAAQKKGETKKKAA